MAAEYTGITLTAGQGLLTNQGIRTPPALINAVSSYQSIAIVNQFRKKLSSINNSMQAVIFTVETLLFLIIPVPKEYIKH